MTTSRPSRGGPNSDAAWRRARRAGALLAGLALVSLPARAGLAGDAPESVEEPVIDMKYAQVERVQLVLASANVTDKKGRPKAGLKAKDFRLTVEGQPRAIEFFATESEAPVAIAFMLDVSGSMRFEGKLEAAKEQIRWFVDMLRGQDRFGLIAFADHQVTWITEFTSDATMFKRRLDAQTGYGQTALYDALAASPHLVDEGIQARKAVVLFTDGLDNASTMSALEAIQKAREASVPIYAISFLHHPPELLAPESRDALRLVERFCRETGGKPFFVLKPEDLPAAVASIQDDLRLQYVIGFQPPDNERTTAFRRIRLETVHPRLLVRCRTGYYAGR